MYAYFCPTLYFRLCGPCDFSHSHSTLQPQTVHERMRMAVFPFIFIFLQKQVVAWVWLTNYNLPTLTQILHFLPFTSTTSNVLGSRNLKKPAFCPVCGNIIQTMQVVQEILVHCQFRGSLSLWFSHYLKKIIFSLLQSS